MNPSTQAYRCESRDIQKWVLCLHLSCVLGFVLILGNIMAPAMMWLLRRHESDFINHHGKEAVNFQFTMVIASLACIPFMFSFGLHALFILFVLNVLSVLCAAIAAYQGKYFRYFFSFNFLDFQTRSQSTVI